MERRKRGLSQRGLGEITHFTQGQISRIENGKVDPRHSTAIEPARALEMELILVPHRRLCAVEAVVGRRENEAVPYRRDRNWPKRLRAVRSKLGEEPGRRDFARIHSLLREAERRDHDAMPGDYDRPPLSDVDRLLEGLDDAQCTNRLLALLKDWQNRAAQRALAHPAAARSVRPTSSTRTRASDVH